MFVSFLSLFVLQGMARVKQQQEGGRYLIGFTYGMYVAGCGEYLDILIYSNIFRYEYSFVSYSYHFFDANIFRYSFVLFFWYEYIRIFIRFIFLYEYIRIFIRIIFFIWIYSDIRSYHFFDKNIFGYPFMPNFLKWIYSNIRLYQYFDMNIFGYSFVSFFGYKYI